MDINKKHVWQLSEYLQSAIELSPIYNFDIIISFFKQDTESIQGRPLRVLFCFVDFPKKEETLLHMPVPLTINTFWLMIGNN